jgi:hypothetical protein
VQNVRWLNLNLHIHKQIYKDRCRIANQLLLTNKKDYFSNKIAEAGCDQKQLHNVTNLLMGNKRNVVLPSNHSDEQLPLVNFSWKKLRLFELICVSRYKENINVLRANESFEGCQLTSCSPVSANEIRNIILKAKSKSCKLDPIPT